jgi:hypothetical protein
MIKILGVLIKVFFLIELAISSVVLIIFVFLEELTYISEGIFSLDNLWLGLRDATFVAIPASLIIWLFYYVVPALKNNLYVNLYF